jgi:hypothetical protein
MAQAAPTAMSSSHLTVRSPRPEEREELERMTREGAGRVAMRA